MKLSDDWYSITAGPSSSSSYFPSTVTKSFPLSSYLTTTTATAEELKETRAWSDPQPMFNLVTGGIPEEWPEHLTASAWPTTPSSRPDTRVLEACRLRANVVVPEVGSETYLNAPGIHGSFLFFVQFETLPAVLTQLLPIQDALLPPKRVSLKLRLPSLGAIQDRLAAHQQQEAAKKVISFHLLKLQFYSSCTIRNGLQVKSQVLCNQRLPHLPSVPRPPRRPRNERSSGNSDFNILYEHA